MTTLNFKSFDGFTLSIDGKPIQQFYSQKAKALLIYLAVEFPRQIERSYLASLLWPDYSETRARRNLSQTLTSLRKDLGLSASEVPLFLSSAHKIGLNPEFNLTIDVHELMRALEFVEEHDHLQLKQCESCKRKLQLAVSYFQGPFLTDFYLPENNEFEEWISNQRAYYDRQAMSAYDKLLGLFEKTKNYEQLLTYAWQQLEHDELRETTHRKIMNTLAKLGRRQEAIAKYHFFANRLQEELAIEPSLETRTLFEQIEAEHIRQTQIKKKRQTALASERREHLHSTTEEADNNVQSTPPPQNNAQLNINRAPASYLETPTISQGDRQKQLILLEKVHNAWVKGILEQLNQLNFSSSLLDLNRQKYNQAVNTPWSGIIESVSRKEPIPKEKSVLDLFWEADRSLLILGEPGAGKTTTLIQLAAQLIELSRKDAQQPIPVVLNLSSWAETKVSLYKWIVNELSAKYQIPARLGKSWLDNHQLLLLLDGLDEMAHHDQPKCVEAINAFRASYGLTGVVVCCRLIDYEFFDLKLDFGGAFLIEPLTSRQVNEHLQEGGPELNMLRNLINEDSALLQMARSPLMLSIMQMAYGAGDSSFLTELAIDRDSETAVRRKHLFNTYIERMLKRREADRTYSDAQIQKWLSWVAHKMNMHNQTIFLGEQIQPSWLPSNAQRWFYVLFSRSIVMGTLTGIYVWGFHMLGILNFPNYQSTFVNYFSSQFQIPPLLSFISFFILIGSFVGLLDGFLFDQRDKKDNIARLELGPGLQHRTGVFVLIFVLCAVLISLFDPFQLGIFTGIIAGINYTIGFDYIKQSQSWRTEVRSIRSISWSWVSASKGIVEGLFWGGILGWAIGSLYNFQSGFITFIYFILLFFLIVGLERTTLSTSNKPNEGILLSFRNFLIALPLISLFPAVYIWVALGRDSVIYGLINGAIIALIFGGADSIKHYGLRLMLWLNRDIPWRFFDFLTNATQYVFLRQVGGGYVFTHRFLQLHFAERFSEFYDETNQQPFTEVDAFSSQYQTHTYPHIPIITTDSSIQPVIANRFVIEELIGAGSMGEVYRGFDIENQNPVAIKQLRAYLALDYPKAVDRFVQEGELLRQLDHPNIVKIIATDQQTNHYYIITEFIPQGSLQDFLNKRNMLPIDEIIDIGLEISDALTRAHHLKIIHRDIKPANILLTESGVPKVADFGEAHFGQSTERITGKGSFIGTPLYVSPEICKGSAADELSDVWSFGIVLYEMLTGKTPFYDEQPLKILSNIVNEPVPLISEFRDDVPFSFEEMIYHMLQKEPAQRLNSMRTVGAKLEQIKRDITQP